MSNLDYRGADQTTYRLVLMVFLTGTAMLALDKISGGEWVTGVVGLVASYVVKQVGQSASEAYRDRPTTTVMNTDNPTVTTTTTTGKAQDAGQ